MSVIYIHSGTEYINYGSTWTDGCGNIELVNDISFSAAQLNAVGTGNLYTGFNAIFDGAGFKITIQPYSATNILNEGLIRDLSGGTIRNLTLDISGLVIDWGASLGETGILVTQKKPFNSGVDRGAYGTIQNIDVSFNNCNLANPENSALLPKWFAANGAGPVTITEITLNGTLTSNSSSCGIIGTDMFYQYNNTAVISSIFNNIKLSDGLSLFGINFGKRINTNAIISIDNVINYADISSNSSRVAGPIIGRYALRNSLGGLVSINGAINYGEINQGSIGGIIGSDFCSGSSNLLDVFVSNCQNTRNINSVNSGGIIGPYMNEAGSANIHILNCTNSGTINGAYSGGIVGAEANTGAIGGCVEILNCDNTGNLVAEGTGGIVGSSCGYNITNSAIIINGCRNSGSIDASNSSGIIGSDFGYLSNPTNLGYNIYSVGGTGTNLIRKYIDASNAWVNVGVLSENKANTAVANYNNAIYIIGGSTTQVVSSVEKFDGSGNTSTFDVSLNIARQSHGATTYKGNIYVAGGIGNTLLTLSSMERFNGKQWVVDATLLTPRHSFGMVSYKNKMYAIGGFQFSALSTVEKYDGTSWSYDASMNNKRFQGYYVVYNDYIYAIGGIDENYQPLNSIERFNGTTWETLILTIPSPISPSNANAVVYNGFVYLFILSENVCYKFDGTNFELIETDTAIEIFSNIVVSQPALTITKCHNYGTLNQMGVGGIVPTETGRYLTSNATILVDSCINDGSFNSVDTGGIAGTHLNRDGNGTVIVAACSNNTDLSQNNCAGIVGNYAGNNSSGKILVSACNNTGSLIGTDVSNLSVVSYDYPFFNPNPINDYKASAGIVGQNCGYHLAQTGFIQLNSCKNYGEFVGDFTAGIASFGIGFGSQGNIQLINCENHSTMNDRQSGIVVGLVGIDNSGVIIFDGCKNYGDISGASTENLTSGLIGSIGYINTAGNETSGVIEVIRCVNANNIYTNKITHGGIVGALYLSQTKQIALNVQQCISDVYSINGLDGETFLGGIVGYICDLSSTTLLNIVHEINIHGCEVSHTTYNITSNNDFLIADSKILGDVTTLVDNGNTLANINIYDNSVNIIETSPYAFTTGVSNFNFQSNLGQTGQTIYNKEVNIYDNTITIDNIQTNLENIIATNKLPAYATFSPINATDCSFNISANTITINEVSNTSRVGGILFNFTLDLSNVDIIVLSNNITINNIDQVSENIGGIINISTNIEIKGSFQNGNGITLEIINNTISSNTPDALSNEIKGNGAIFSVNTSAIVPPTYVPPTGQLTIVGNILSDNFFNLTKTYLSDYYFPSYFRPYIYNLQPEFPGSNYWFGPGEPIIELLGDVNTGASGHVIGNQSNDTILRQIFKRAVNAINEQIRFEIYPFYHLKVKANKM